MPERVSGAARNGCRLRFAKANRECAIVARRRMYVRTQRAHAVSLRSRRRQVRRKRIQFAP